MKANTANTIESWHYNKKTGLPMKKGMFAMFLNCILWAILGVVKTTSSIVRAIFPTGIDNKKVIKE